MPRSATASTIRPPTNYKPWATRTSGAKKKFHEIHWIFGAMTAALVLKDGELDVYESQPGFLKNLPQAQKTNRETAIDFLTLEEQELGPSQPKDREKSLKGRTIGAMRKVHEIHTRYGALTAGLIVMDDVLIIYESSPNFAPRPDGVEKIEMITPKKFIKARDRASPYTSRRTHNGDGSTQNMTKRRPPTPSPAVMPFDWTQPVTKTRPPTPFPMGVGLPAKICSIDPRLPGLTFPTNDVDEAPVVKAESRAASPFPPEPLSMSGPALLHNVGGISQIATGKYFNIKL